MEKIEDYLVETTIGDMKDGRLIRMYYQGKGYADDKEWSLMTQPVFSRPIDGEVEAPVVNNSTYGAYVFSPTPVVHPTVPIRFDKKDAIGYDIYINIDNCDLDSDRFNINKIGFGIHSDGITLSGSLHPIEGPVVSDNPIENMRNLWIYGISDPLTDDLYGLYGHNCHVRRIPIVFKLIESAWNFLKGDKPIWKFDKSFMSNDTDEQAWKMVVTMILNSEYTMLHQSLMNDYIAEAENYFHRMEENEKDIKSLAGGNTIAIPMHNYPYSYFQDAFVFMSDFFDILTECNKLELLRQIPLETRSKMIQLFNKAGKHELVALLNHYHKGDYRSLDTMEGWEL